MFTGPSHYLRMLNNNMFHAAAILMLIHACMMTDAHHWTLVAETQPQQLFGSLPSIMSITSRQNRKQS